MRLYTCKEKRLVGKGVRDPGGALLVDLHLIAEVDEARHVDVLRNLVHDPVRGPHNQCPEE